MIGQLHEQAELDAVRFIGEVLGPLFLGDPVKDAACREVIAQFAQLDAEQVSEEWPFVEPDDARDVLTPMCQSASEVTLAHGQALELLADEYRRLFVGPATKPAPPWGSVYTDKECVVFGQSCLQLRHWMRHQGIQREDGNSEPEDHIGRLFLLLAWCAQHKPVLVDELLSAHILPWSSHFLEQLYDAAEHPFYKGLAQLGRFSLEGMKEVFGLEVVYPRFYR